METPSLPSVTPQPASTLPPTPQPWSPETSEFSEVGSDLPSNKEERAASLAIMKARHDAATKELARLQVVMEDALGEEEAVMSLAEINSSPDDFMESRRPIFRKTAAAVKEEREVATRMGEIEQEIRDHSMSPADMLVEARALIRKQNVAFEVMRTENEGLHARLSTLEAVVGAMTSLPQISRSDGNVCSFAKDAVGLEALEGGLATRTLLQYAAQNQLEHVVDYLLLNGHSIRGEPALVILNPPEEQRKYEVPKTTAESSVLGQQAKWQPCKPINSQFQQGWLTIDAGRRVNLMGWKLEVQGDVPFPSQGSYLLQVSNDGVAWQKIDPEATWDIFKRDYLPVINHPHCDSKNERLQNIAEIPHKSHIHAARKCIAHARYFRFVPNAGYSQQQHTHKKVAFGLLILDDQGEFLVGPRYVRDLSPLHVAAKTGDAALLQKLLDHGASPELLAGCFKDGDRPFQGGKTALQLAAASASLEAVTMLVDRGAKVDEDQFEVPKGKAGDLVAGFLQTNGSKPVTRVGA